MGAAGFNWGVGKAFQRFTHSCEGFMPGMQTGRSPSMTIQAPQFWPDIDVYFKRDIDLAFDLIDQLCSAGVRVIKAAALHDADCCLLGPYATTYHVAGVGAVRESYRAVIERHVVALPDLRRICAYTRNKGLELVLSAYDNVGIELARDFEAMAVKIPSSNVVHAPLIRSAAASGLPLVIDTGRSTINEIDQAVTWARTAGAVDLLLQHSPPGPPALPSDFHLSVLPELGRRYQVRYGLSDHFSGTEMFPIAVALGVSVIEKGVCADNTVADIDIAHALPVSQVAKAMTEIQRAFDSLGDPSLNCRVGTPRPLDRMGLVAARDLLPGDEINISNVRFAFPTKGIGVEEWDSVVGNRLATSVIKMQPIRRTHLRPP